jgi:hypothetical protein
MKWLMGVISLFVVIYHIFHPTLLLSFIIVACVILWVSFLIEKNLIDVDFTELLSGTLVKIYAVLFLILSVFNFRFTYDGLIYHIKNIFLLNEDLVISYFEKPWKPYLFELLLTPIFHYFSFYGLNFIFGIISIFNIFLVYKLFVKLGVKKELIPWMLFALFCSSIYVLHLYILFKVDLFLTDFFLLSLFYYWNKKDSLTTHHILVLGLLSGIGVLIKSTYLLTTLAFFVLIITRLKLNYRILFFILTSLFPLVLWAYLFGFSVPRFFTFNHTGVLTKIQPGFALVRDMHVSKSCYDQRVVSDYNGYIYGTTWWQHVIQPIYYVLGYKTSFAREGVQGQPGPLIYLGFLLSPFAWYLFKKELDTSRFKDLYIITLISYIGFLLVVGKVYWYLLPVFPFSALTITLLFDKYLRRWIGYYKYYILIESSVLLFYANLSLILLVKPFHTPVPPSEFLNSLKGKILDTTEIQTYIPVTLMENSDKRVVPALYYFAASPKSTEDQYKELKNNGIEYILAVKRDLNPGWYTGGCLALNGDREKEFLSKYTIPIAQVDGEDAIFKIK